jgi:hypothetical protein
MTMAEKTPEAQAERLISRGVILADMMLMGVKDDDDMKITVLSLLSMPDKPRQLTLISLISAKLGARELKQQDGMLQSWLTTLIEQSIHPDEAKQELVNDTQRLLDALTSKAATQADMDAAVEALLKGRKR